MRRYSILLIFLISLSLLAGCLNSPENPEMDNQSNNNTTKDENNIVAGNNSFYNQTPHMGCQIGEIEKNGTCSVTFSGQNAEIFSIKKSFTNYNIRKIFGWYTRLYG